MQRSLLLSLIGAASFAAALLVGCGDNDAKPVSSAAGQSCTRTADCADGLSCIANVCYKSAPVVMGEGGAATVTTPPGPVLGAEGESCNSHTDCQAGLGCFNQRCTASASGEGGAGNPAVQLGSQGEACVVNADCVTGLVCIPSTVTGTGECDVQGFGLTVTGMTCAGECTTALDCCQLPIAQQGALGVRSCEDIDAAITAGPVDCTSATLSTLNAGLCSAQLKYCGKCTKNTWSCTNSACVYNGSCAAGSIADTVKGCPSITRLGNIVPACNDTALTCTGAAVVGGCTTNASCDGKIVADSSPDTCSTGECTCYAGDKACYRMCRSDIDCTSGRSCDTKTSVCVPSKACVDDTQCALIGRSLDYKCNMATNNCAFACTTDRDCSATGHDPLTGGGTTFNTYVCGADNFCAPINGQCSDSSQCTAAAGQLRPFCVLTPTPAPSTDVASAISD